MSNHEKGERPHYKMKAVEKEALKFDLYERAQGACEHPQGCTETNIDKLTIDHFTPQAIARIWGWTPQEVNDPLNLILLCRRHHDEKDQETPKIKAENMIEYAIFKDWAIPQRRIFAQKQIELEEKTLLAA